MPATMTIARIGSERASTSVSSSSRQSDEDLRRPRQHARHEPPPAPNPRLGGVRAGERLGVGDRTRFRGTAPSPAEPSARRFRRLRQHARLARDDHLCAACNAENEPGRKFCGECGSALARACPSCGTANAPATKFCGECGSTLDGSQPRSRSASASAPDRRAPPRLRPLRRPRRVHDRLRGTGHRGHPRAADAATSTRSRTIIERYGGTVEKFIGDAVMAVWGTPVATEDDAERAVRAALDLVAAVSALGDEAGAHLRARAGVLTGEAAVTLGAHDQGMVAGDLVNTASRIQSAAEPGTVAVGESTRRTTEAAIAYADAGTFELKGKDEPVPLWRALRVISGRQGALKGTGLEAPFVGPRPRAAEDQGRLPLVGRGEAGAPGLGHRDRRDRQVAARVGVRQVHRRPRRRTSYWHRGPLPLVRRRRHLLGARRHGADALPDHRGRAVRVGALEARRDARRAPARRRRAPLRRAAPRATPRARRPALGRQAGPVRRLAAVLRAARRRLPDSAGLRGRPVGRREPARLHRVPARVVPQQPVVRAHARPPGAARAPADLGRRAPQLQLAVPRALAARGDGGAARRARPRPAAVAPRPDPRPRGGDPALRRRDGADAARPRAARRGRRGLHAGRRRSTSWRCPRRCTR